MKAILFVWLLSGLAVSAATNLAVEAWCHFETGTAGDLMTPTLMTNSSTFTFGSWSQTGNALAMITNIDQQLTLPVVINGTSYGDSNATRSLSFRIDSQTNFAQLTFRQSFSNISVGSWITFASIADTFCTVDYIDMDDASGKFAVIQSGANFGLHAHASTNNVTTLGPDITIQTNVTYYVTYTFTNGSPGGVTVNVYGRDGSTIGTSTCPSDAGPMIWLKFGRVDNHACNPPATSWVIYDDLVISTNATFPLGFPWRTTAPTSPLASRSRTAASVSWSAPTNNGGSTITNYAVWRDGAFLTNNGTAASMGDGAVNPGQTYNYTINAGNTAGDSVFSGGVSITVPLPIDVSAAGKLTLSGKAILK